MNKIKINATNKIYIIIICYDFRELDLYKLIKTRIKFKIYLNNFNFNNKKRDFYKSLLTYSRHLRLQNVYQNTYIFLFL